MVHDRPAEARNYSLPEVNQSVGTTHTSVWKRIFAFAGPAYLVSVGYMDPGNWATDLEGGARFGYRLLWVLVASNLMALLLQTLSSRLGIVTRRDLAQACHDQYPAAVSYILWILCEVAIIACDLAEVLGAAIGLNLLFHLPILAGILLTAADTLLVLWFTRLGIRVIEAFVLVLIGTIAICFSFEIFLARPAAGDVVMGLVPHLNINSLYLAVAIFGATVMPHNLYLHSALVQTRRIGDTDAEKRTACRFNLFDSTIALNAALFVNAAILIMAAAVFFTHGIVVTEIQQAHSLLAPLMGTTAASVLFGAALLCSGQSSTLTGTMAGQIVMEGFVRFRMQPWLRRAVTRMLAIVPAVVTLMIFGNRGTTELIILSQVVLNLQLPFAVIPLVRITSDRGRMGAFANGPWLKGAAWSCAAFIVGLNSWLIWTEIAAWTANPAWASARAFIWTGAVLGGLAFAALLGVVLFWPTVRRRSMRVVAVAGQEVPILPSRIYERILVPLDHTHADGEALGNAVALARSHRSRLFLLHVEEGITSQMLGSLSSTAEVAEGQDYLAGLVASLAQQNVQAEVLIRYGKNPAAEIASAVKAVDPDLVVMASHGHRGLKDLIFGTTINSVRHLIRVPLLIVRDARR